MRSSRSLIILVAIVLFAYACGGNGGSDDESSTTAAESPTTDGGGTVSGTGTMVYWDFGGLHNEGMTEVWLDPFAAEHGITIVSDIRDSAKIQAMVENNNVTWDVGNENSFFIDQNCGTLFEPLDYDVIDRTVLDEANYGECWIAPTAYGEILGYNPELVETPPTSWQDFFDLEKIPGPRGMYDAGGQGQEFEVALIGDGVAPEDALPIDFDRAREKLNSLGDELVLQTFGSEQIQQVVSGEVVMALLSTSRALEARRAGESIEVVWETQFIGTNTFGIVKGAPNKDLAMEFLNELLDPEKQIQFAERTLFGPLNPDAAETINEDPELCPIVLTCPSNVFPTTTFIDADYYTENLDEIGMEWNEWKESQ